MPAHPLCIALYLLELTEDALQKNSGCSAIDSALYGIRWAHKIAGLESPTEWLVLRNLVLLFCVG